MHFEEIIKRIFPTLKRITYKLAAGNTLFNCEDLFQEASLHLWQAFQSDELKDKTDSYILQGCYFYLKNHMRKSKPRSGIVSIEEIMSRENQDASLCLCLADRRQEGFLEYLNDKLLAETIRDNGLTTREKELLPLFAEGLTTREIGKRLGISHVRVVKLASRIRGKCRKYLDIK